MATLLPISVDPNDPEPPYAQIRDQIAAMVRCGSLAVGLRLPSVRRLATDLALAPGTVARAYRELEAGGLIDTRGRHGSYVADPGDQAAASRQRLARAADQYARLSGELGIKPDTAIEQVEQALRDLFRAG